MNKLNKRLTDVLTKNAKDSLLLMRIQQDKLFDKIPLFIETATDEELEVAMKECRQEELNEFSKYFEDNELVHNRIISHDTADRIRYGFLQYCIHERINIIKYDVFEKFAKLFNIKEEIIVVYEADEYEEFDQNATIDDLLLEVEEDEIKPLQTSTFEYIAQLTTDLAVDQNPREFKDFVKFFDKDGKEIKSRVYEAYNNRLTMYERDVIQYLFGFDTYFFM